MAKEAVLSGGAVVVEAALEGCGARLWSQHGQVGPLPRGRVAHDVEARTLLQHEQAVEGGHQRTPARPFAVAVVPAQVTERRRAPSSAASRPGERGTALNVQDWVRVIISRGLRAACAARKERPVAMRRQLLHTARQRSTDSDGRRTRISASASSHRAWMSPPPDISIRIVSFLLRRPWPERTASIGSGGFTLMAFLSGRDGKLARESDSDQRSGNKSVLRCRAVCRSWRRITTDRSFLADHAARPSAPGQRTPCLSPAATRPPRSRLLYRKQLDRDGTPMVDSFDVLYSLDGLLVLNQRRGLFIVCNPIIRQWTNLPALASEPCFTAIACGFYLHGSSGEYRLLTTTSPWLIGGSSTGSLCTPNPPAPAPAGKMLAFDTASETFRLMSRPPERTGDTARVLLELDGELSVAAMQGVTSLAIWALQDYKAEIWTLRYVTVWRESLVLHAFFDSPHSSEVAYIKFSDWKVHGCLVLVSIDVSLME
ncbi:LOW QUALITY PROTEIN: hypothetical protein SETIT_3G127200v2 [Setaria italica]|uniref:F-box domain-containing protein n=1 Tax=Setaria italica TaxID=4555 RepID=A0A368QEK1_SETIT|nr:LOW QUALITY PROTEIN: hypothetical protein SETIT_3G127200v2 [Setaria italica]